MRLAALLLAAALAGCARTPDAVLVGGLKQEIASIGSMAQVPGPRSPDEVEGINARVRKAWGVVDAAVR